MTKRHGPQFSTSSIATSDHTNSATKLCDANWKLPSTPSLCTHVSEVGRAPMGTALCRGLPCFLLFLRREGAQGKLQCLPPAPAQVFLRACVWVSCLLLRAQCRPSSSTVTLARGELSGWQHLFSFGFVS